MIKGPNIEKEEISSVIPCVLTLWHSETHCISSIGNAPSRFFEILAATSYSQPTDCNIQSKISQASIDYSMQGMHIARAEISFSFVS